MKYKFIIKPISLNVLQWFLILPTILSLCHLNARVYIIITIILSKNGKLISYKLHI